MENIDVDRLLEAMDWIRDDEGYTAYYERLTIRISTMPEIGAVSVTLLDYKNKMISFASLPEERRYFFSLLEDKLAELYNSE